MFRKILVPAAVRLNSVRPLTTLTRQARPSVVFRHDVRTSLLSNLKISPIASFLHTQTAAPTAVAQLETTVEEDVVEKVQAARFDSVDIQPATLKAVEKVFKYQDMSTVQEAVLNKLPNDKDMFVKAKTGTGKTLAFLIAALETATKDMKNLKHFDGTSILVISPTRELANQIADEADKLTAFYPFKVHCMVGGDSKRRQISKLERSRADIVVATPGRLNDMLSSVPRFKKMCENLKVLVLDEADQLLDMGFKQELQRILNQLPTERQTMLYSATISPEIRENLGKFALSPEYDLIDTVGKNEANTHLHVKQSALVAPYTDQFSLIRDVLQTNEAAQKGKVIVFLPTTKATMVYSEIFKRLLPDRTIYEIHSKKGQDQRSRIANRFRNSGNSILFTSDVSARGVDYPGVSLVVQIGVPSTREQYIHRLGRTGRAGREGEGLILLAPFEKEFLTNEIADLPVQTLETPEVTHDDRVETKQSIAKSLNMMDEETVREVYTAYLGYYSGRMGMLNHRRSKTVTEANAFLEGLGIEEPPYLSERFLAQIGVAEPKRGGGGNRRNNRSFDRRDNRSNDRSSRRNDDFGFKSRSNDNFRSSRRNSYNDDRSSFSNRRDDSNSGFRSRRDDGGDSGFRSRRDDGGDSGYKRRSDDGFRSKRRDSFRENNDDSGYKRTPRRDFNSEA